MISQQTVNWLVPGLLLGGGGYVVAEGLFWGLMDIVRVLRRKGA